MSHSRRRSIRLQNYDYTQNGAYFVTICAKGREEIFGNIQAGVVHLSPVGQIIAACWLGIPKHFSQVELDDFVVMPNHLHGIVLIVGGVGARHGVPLQGEAFGKPVSGSLPTVIRSFKTAAAKAVNGLRDAPGETVWQRNYYEHVIRSEVSLNAIRQYIQSNPAQWENDRENPTRRNASGNL